MSKGRKLAVLWSTAAIVGLLIGGVAGPAAAGIAYGNWGSLFGGGQYQGRSVINNTNDYAAANTRHPSGNVSPGWLGGQGRLYYQSTGALIRQSTWVYNSITAYAGNFGHTSGYSLPGPYYSYSLSRGWLSSSSSYSTYYNFASPALNF